jgi:hypothetical protein
MSFPKLVFLSLLSCWCDTVFTQGGDRPWPTRWGEAATAWSITESLRAATIFMARNNKDQMDLLKKFEAMAVHRVPPDGDSITPKWDCWYYLGLLPSITGSYVLQDPSFFRPLKNPCIRSGHRITSRMLLWIMVTLVGRCGGAGAGAFKVLYFRKNQRSRHNIMDFGCNL